MNARRAVILTAAALLVAPVARSGHEQSVYPSYYPHEIEIATRAPQQAAELMRAGKLHAYVGGAPSFTTPPADTIATAKSLGAFIVVQLNPVSPTACATATAIVRDMAERAGNSGLVVHPYPVTPFHGDYLAHADRADATRQRLLGGDAAPPPVGLKVRTGGTLVRSLVRSEWLSDAAWDAAIVEIGAAALVADATVTLNGWLGPRWTRSGWFHAYRLLGPSITEPDRKQQIDAAAERLQAAAYDGAVERLNLERDLVALLTSGCRAMVAGYTTKREYFNAAFSTGIENISFDALEGFSSPMFLRTVKLKDFPWNGWLQLGLDGRPAAAWNPIGGFTDPFGRLMWFAIADPAAIPSPYEAAWTLNRISEVEASPRR